MDGNAGRQLGSGQPRQPDRQPDLRGRPGGQALSLNGTSQNASVPDNNSLDLTTGMTLAAWIRQERLATQDLSRRPPTAGRTATSSGARPRRQGLRPAQPGDFRATPSGSTRHTYPTNGTWMHVAATYDGTTIKLYVNGSMKAPIAGPARDRHEHPAGRTRRPERQHPPVHRRCSTTPGSMARPDGLARSRRWPAPAPNGPPNAPTLNAPANGATGIGTSPTLSVGVIRPGHQPDDRDVLRPTVRQRQLHPDRPEHGRRVGQQHDHHAWAASVPARSSSGTRPSTTGRPPHRPDLDLQHHRRRRSGLRRRRRHRRSAPSRRTRLPECHRGASRATSSRPATTSTTRHRRRIHELLRRHAGARRGQDADPPGSRQPRLGHGRPETSTATSAYFGANATDADGKSYYSYNIAGSNWHVVNLDSECQARDRRLRRGFRPGALARGRPCRQQHQERHRHLAQAALQLGRHQLTRRSSPCGTTSMRPASTSSSTATITSTSASRR